VSFIANQGRISNVRFRSSQGTASASGPFLATALRHCRDIAFGLSTAGAMTARKCKVPLLLGFDNWCHCNCWTVKVFRRRSETPMTNAEALANPERLNRRQPV
jgi:hypothetical protein